MKTVFLAFWFLITFFVKIFDVSADAGILSQNEFDRIKGNAIVEGHTGAQILVVRYSDMECPSCINLNNNVAFWKNLQTKYGNKISHIYKNNRGANHQYTQEKAIAAICIKKIAGGDSYVKFYNTVFKSSNIRMYSMNRIPSFLRAEKISIAKYNQCIRNPDSLNEFYAETAEANRFNLYATPGVLFINTNTLKYESLEGFYYMDTYYDTVDKLLN